MVMCYYGYGHNETKNIVVRIQRVYKNRLMFIRDLCNLLAEMVNVCGSEIYTGNCTLHHCTNVH